MTLVYAYLLLLSSVTLPNVVGMDQPCFLEVSEDNAVFSLGSSAGTETLAGLTHFLLSSAVRKSFKKLRSNIAGVSFEFIPQTTR